MDKSLQESSAHHFVQVPLLSNPLLCPVQALKKLLASRKLSPQAPLFAHAEFPYFPVIDTTFRQGLKQILQYIGIPLLGHGFHAFCRSGATLAFDNNVQIQDIMAHGLWKSSAVWQYLENVSGAPSVVPLHCHFTTFRYFNIYSFIAWGLRTNMYIKLFRNLGIVI